MNAVTKTTHLDNVVLVKLDPHIWSGRKKLKPEDLGKAVSDLPPEELASLGSKKIFDPSRLYPFHRLHRAAERACSSVGIKFLGGFAIPEQDAKNIIQQLDQIKAEFLAEKTKFIQEYNQIIQDMIATYPTWNHMLINSILSVEVAAGRINWDWDAMKVVSAGFTAADDKMAEKATGMSGQLFEEVSKEGVRLSETLLGKEKVSRNVLTTVRNIRKKLSGLSFLDNRVGPVVQQIDNTLLLMPNDRPIEGNELVTLIGLSYLLSNPDRMKLHGEKILKVQSGEVKEVIEPEMPEMPQAAEQQPVDANPAEDVQQATETEMTQLALEEVDASEEDYTVIPAEDESPSTDMLFNQEPIEEKQEEMPAAVGWF